MQLANTQDGASHGKNLEGNRDDFTRLHPSSDTSSAEMLDCRAISRNDMKKITAKRLQPKLGGPPHWTTMAKSA